MWGETVVPFTAWRLWNSAGESFCEKTTRSVVSEATLQVCLDGRPVARLLCLPQEPLELAAGHLYMERWIERWEDVLSISARETEDSSSVYTVDIRTAAVRPDSRERAQGGLKPMRDRIACPLSLLWRLVGDFKERSELHRSVGGVHSALLYHPQGEIFREDFGRHNCLDRIAGHLLRRGLIAQTRESVLISSGRISTEMLSKALRLAIPVYISLKTPTDQAIQMARRYRVTLIGHADSGEAFLYAGKDRILFT